MSVTRVTCTVLLYLCCSREKTQVWVKKNQICINVDFTLEFMLCVIVYKASLQKAQRQCSKVNVEGLREIVC